MGDPGMSVPAPLARNVLGFRGEHSCLCGFRAYHWAQVPGCSATRLVRHPLVTMHLKRHNHLGREMAEWSVVESRLAHIGPRFSPPGPFGRTNGEVGHRNDEDLRASCWCLPGGMASASSRAQGASTRCAFPVSGAAAGCGGGAAGGTSTQGCWQSGRPLA